MHAHTQNKLLSSLPVQERWHNFQIRADMKDTIGNELTVRFIFCENYSPM
jgi:hypothetical protein